MLINQDNSHIDSVSNTSVSDSNTITEKKNNLLPSINFLDEISDFIFISKYARYNEDQKRRETLSEAIDRVSQMHLEKYSFLPDEDKQKIKWAFELVKQKKVVPSMRSMQFGGKAVFAHNPRLYNCGTRHIDSLRAFSEFFYCLLTGTGMTAGVSKKIISRLPDLVTDKDKTGTILTYTIQDDIEGWADSIEALLMCYHKNTPFTGRKIVFDYSKIRKKGSPLKTGGGKAPGHAGLKQTHTKIKNLLDHIIEDLHLNNLRSIDIYDILMHCADAVLSGGIRRAATAVIFDPDDMDMMNAKTNFSVSSHKRFEKLESGFWEGTVIVNNKKYEVILSDWEYNESLVKNKEIGWYHIEPQRARSNNSVLLLRSNTTKEQLEDIINKTRQWGEPGFVFADDPLTLFNPCITADTIIETNKGKIKASELVERLKMEEDIFALSMNIESKQVEMQQILYGEMTNESAEIYELELEDGSVRKFSKGHLIYTENRGYVKIEDLIDTDEVILSC